MPPSAKRQLKAAKALIDAGDFQGALPLLDALIASDPHAYHAHVLRGLSLRSLSDLPAALSAYHSAVALRPESALAYKGILAAVPPDDPLPAHRAALARAHAALADLALSAPRPADPPPYSRRAAADIMHAAALEDPSLVDDAVRLHLSVPRHPAPQTHLAARPEWRAAQLLASRLPAPPAARNHALREPHPTLRDVLARAADLCTRSAIAVVQDDARRAVEDAAVLGCEGGEHAHERGVQFLRECGAHEALLRLAETNIGAGMSPRLVAAFAFREMHAFPKSGAARRARFVMAAELARVGKDAAAWEAAGLSAMKAGAAPPRPASCTQALVVAAMRLARGENKLAGMAARAGRSMAQEEGSRDRLAVLCGLLVAAAQAGEREFKDAVAEYGKARAYARDVGDAWIENAADQGMVQTCVAAYGRKSRQTSMAIEEAAGAADNCYGLLESTWTDALVGDDVDMETMEALADRAVVEVQGIREEDSELGWHARALGDSFVMPKAMLAAIAKSRHGQMLMAQKQPTLECVKQAQGCQMEAATLHKGLPNPFAHLGWIFEKRHELLHDDRSLLRAMRCYEKAVGMDAAHPLAARSLARLLKDSGNESEAVLVAREAVGRNPKARWAHNLIGWSRIRKIRYNEACISFRNALKGKPQLSSRAREVLYGTTVGQTVGDNDLLIDVDSWRGLSVAYMRQGMFGPAIACLEDALQLAKNPPYFVTVTVGNFGQLRESLALLLESEKSVLMQLDGQSADARNSMESILQDSRAPGTIKRYLSEALVYIAAKDWVSGCYSRATKGRICAAQLLEQTLVDHKQDMPSLNPSSLWKELGDTLVEVGTSHPKFMQELIGAAEISTALSQAEVAYMRALHYSPWEKQKRVQDAIAAMLRSAVVKNDTAYESKAVDLLSQSQLDPSVMALLVLDCAAIQEKESVQRAALEIALRVAKSVVSTKHLIALEASVATVAAQLGDIAVGAWTSVSAVSRDPSNWWGWFAVGVIREADARINGWPLAMIQSSEGAYREADKLGGGPCAVRGLLRCLIKKLEKRKDIDWNAEDSYAEACFCISTAARVGVSEPSACREVIDEFRMSKENEAKAQGQQIAESQIASEAYRHVHLYPFLPTALGVALP